MREAIRIGCQTYTWEMLGSHWTGTPDDIISMISAADYDGVEFSNAMIGSYADAPEKFAAALENNNLTCCAYAFGTDGFTDPLRFDQDLSDAKKAIIFCSELQVPLMLAGAAAPSRDNYESYLNQALKLCRAVAEEGARRGITVAIHPHSHHGSLFESAQEYDRLLSETADSGLMFNPDMGHIVRGGQELMSCLRRHRERIVHVHIKDVDSQGSWKPLGEGIINWEEALGFLKESGYSGWIVGEEESSFAFQDQLGAIRGNREFLKKLGH